MGEAAATGEAGVSPLSRASAGWLLAHRRLLAALVLAALTPLVWFIATRPLMTARTSGAAGAGQPAKGVGPQVGAQAPDFTLLGLDGKPVALSSFRGRAVLLNFWATWCEPCKAEMPELERAYQQYKDSPGLVVLAVSIDDASNVSQVRDYIRQGSDQTGAYSFPVVLDSQQEVTRLYKLLGVPSSYFIDRSGVIRAVQPGAMNRQTLMQHLRTIMPLGAA